MTVKINPPSRTADSSGEATKYGGNTASGEGFYETPSDARQRSQRELSADDISLDKLLFDVANSKKKDMRVEDVVLDGDIERTIEGASTITITLLDEDGKIRNSGIFHNKVDIKVDGFWYRYIAANKSGDSLTVTFEDRDVARLRGQKKFYHTTRKHSTRAEFCYFLVRKVPGDKIRCNIPELHKTEPRKKSRNRQETTNEIRRGRGFSPGVNITVKGVTANRAQKKNMAAVLSVGMEMNVSRKLLVCAIMTIIGETTAGNDMDNQRSPIHLGLFQQDERHYSVWWQLGGGRNVPELDAKAFFKQAQKIDQDEPHLGYADLCERVQVSGMDPYATYGRWKQEALKAVDAYQGEQTGEDFVTFKRYVFSTKDDNGKPQNYWDAIKRLMDEVHWRVFYTNGILYMVAEEDLMKSKPRMVVSPGKNGVIDVDFDCNTNKKDESATVTCEAHRWSAPPGSVVELKDCGPADGRWLISSIRRTLFDPETTIVLKKVEHSIKEPANDLKSRDRGGIPINRGGTLKTHSYTIGKIYRAMQRMDSEHYPYAWGGGHPYCGRPSRSVRPGESQVGYDCSGSTAAVLMAGGLGFHKGQSVPNSGWMAANWGEPGEGQYLTVWANSIHVFIEIKIGKKWIHFGTGQWGKSWSGPGFNSVLHPHAGFTPRHWKGL